MLGASSPDLCLVCASGPEHGFTFPIQSRPCSVLHENGHGQNRRAFWLPACLACLRPRGPTLGGAMNQQMLLFRQLSFCPLVFFAPWLQARTIACSGSRFARTASVCPAPYTLCILNHPPAFPDLCTMRRDAPLKSLASTSTTTSVTRLQITHATRQPNRALFPCAWRRYLAPMARARA